MKAAVMTRKIGNLEAMTGITCCWMEKIGMASATGET
jgi:hypothetical protein